ncbi:MAG: TerB family tellurite resistance protein [Dongiaceae bacterium]
MSIFGIILGSTAGLIALGGPLGALLGAAAGHAVGRWRKKKKTKSATGDELPAQSGDQRLATRQIAFTVAAIALGAKMAKADGIVTRDEVDAFKQVFHVPQDEMQNVGRIFDQARKSSLGYEAYAEQIAGMFKRQPTVLEELLDGLFHIAKADGQVIDEEIEYLRSVATIFGFDAAKFARIRASHLGADKSDPFVVLGVAHDAANAEIKAAYRKLVRDNHPDRLIAKGMPKEFVDVATDKLAAINSAYERVARERGIT